LLQIAELKRAVGDPDQPADLMAKMLHDPAHLAVLAFAYGDAEPGVACHLPVEARVDLAIANAVDGDATNKRCQRLGINLALHAHPVFP
jgi:hypothetical protein